MPPQNDLEELKRHPSVLRLFMQRIKLTRQGNRFRGSCPFHDEKTPSLDVYQHDNVYLFKCLGCGVGGNCIQFVEKFDRISFAAAVKLVREFVTGSPEHEAKVVDEVFKPIGSDKPKKVLSLEDIKRYEVALEKNQAARDWLLKERGIDYETAKRLHVGYVQDIGKLIGSSDQEVRDKGWLVFPCIESGQILSIKFRSTSKKVFRRMTGMKSDVLFNADTIDILEPVYLVEGEVDAATMEMASLRSVSLPNATTRVTPEMKDQLLAAEMVVLAGDNDGAAGTEKMMKLKAELGDRAVLITWPFGWKDANEVFLKECKRDVAKFRELVNGLVGTAKSMVMPGIFSLQESMRSHRQTDLANHPERFRFHSWPSVDRMAIILPGDMAAILATSTKLGKTAWITQATLEAAIHYNEVVVSYQAEYEKDRFNANVAALVLRKDRNHLKPEDVREAADRLGNIKYYVGSNPNLNTIGPVLDLIEAAIRRLGATVVILDHIHYLCRNEKEETKAQADAAQRICRIAQTYRVKFFMVEQPRKANQQSRGRRLHTSDGKGSEALHSDSAAIFALHRDMVKVVDPPPFDPYSPITHVHLLGVRSKGDGASEVRLVFLGKFACFAEMAHDSDNQEQGEIF